MTYLYALLGGLALAAWGWRQRRARRKAESRAAVEHQRADTQQATREQHDAADAKETRANVHAERDIPAPTSTDPAVAWKETADAWNASDERRRAAAAKVRDGRTKGKWRW